MGAVAVVIVFIAWFSFWNHETEQRVQREEPQQEQMIEEEKE